MPELLLELFSEEIPARMQAAAAARLSDATTAALAKLNPREPKTFYGPRRIAIAVTIDSATKAAAISERGPRANAPEQALAGFLRKHNAQRSDLREDGTHWVLEKTQPAETAATLIAQAIPAILHAFPWPKSMRWGGTSRFTWIRPLRRILCLLDGDCIDFDLRLGADDGHGLTAGPLTEGHRFHAPAPFAPSGLADWLSGLRDRHVIADPAERRAIITEGLTAIAAAKNLTIVSDPALLDEVTGLVEWPVPLLGRIDPAYMDLPAEVMQVSMRINQRYFALRHPDGTPAPWFAFAANIAASDGGQTIIAGNERVLRARFSDARHFWDLDRRTKLVDRVPALDAITFHADLGSQGERTRRTAELATHIAPLVGAAPADAARAARLAKADLTTGMVGEFPELQGVMGRYYALNENEPSVIADAIRDHYAPKGPTDPVPTAPVSMAVALADKLDLLAGFFGIGQKPTGSGDPFALRRAALGIIRIIRENKLRLGLKSLFEQAAATHTARPNADELLAFLAERLRVQLRTEGARHDVLTAVLAAGADDDITRMLNRTEAVATFLATQDGVDLLAAYRRATNILRIEEARDGPQTAPPDPELLVAPAEKALAIALASAHNTISACLATENDAGAMVAIAALRIQVDEFFVNVIVNDTDAQLRTNRLRLLAALRTTMNLVADFAKIEG